MRRHDLDRALGHLARRQYGAFNHRQARHIGFTDNMLYDRREIGSHVELAHTVYALASFPPTWQRQYKAAELSLPDAAVAGFAAGLVHGFDGFRVVRPEIVVPYTRNVRNRLATVHRSLDSLTTTIDRFTVTTVAQTLFDVMPRLTVDRLERVMDGQLLDGRVTVANLAERLAAYERSRRRGINLWRALVGERQEDGWAPPESELEALLWAIYERVPGRPPARGQAPLPWWKRGRGRSDVLVDDWALILEADGRRWHARVRDFDEDRWRDNLAVAHGYRVLRFTHTHLTQREAEAIEIIAQTGRSIAAA